MSPEILQTISVIIAALSVAIGITAWRRGVVGQRRVELAEEALALFSEAARVFRYVRSPIGYGGEGASRKREENESEEDRDIKDQAFVPIERYNSKVDLFAKIFSLRYRFEAYFGAQATIPFSEVESIINQIISSSHLLSRLWKQQQRYANFDDQALLDRIAPEIERHESIIWDRLDDTDPLNSRIDTMVDSIRTTCQNVINPRITICSLCIEWLSRSRRFWLCRN